MRSEAFRSSVGEKIYDKTSERVIEVGSVGLPNYLSLAILAGAALVSVICVILGLNHTGRTQALLNWEGALGAGVVVGLIMVFFSKLASNEESISAIGVRISTLICSVVLAAGFVLVWTHLHLEAANSSLTLIVLAAVVLVLTDALVSEFLRWVREDGHDSEAFGAPGVGLVILILSGKSLRNQNRQDEGILAFSPGLDLLKSTLRIWIPSVLIFSVFLLWCSTSFSVIPPGHSGVVIVNGVPHLPERGPGLVIHPPTPFGRVFLAATEVLKETRVGFGLDLNKPALWDEPHLKDETLMLTAGGTELVTASLSVIYRVKNVLDFWKSGESASALVERAVLSEWSSLAASGEGMRLIGENRAFAEQSILSGAQKRLDRIGSGLQIDFVGMRDAHPPVETARSYQEVISAKEEMRKHILQTEAEVRGIQADASARSTAILRKAEAERLSAVTRAEAIAGPFHQLVESSNGFSGAVRTIKQFETIEKSLKGRPLMVVSSPILSGLDLGIDLRGRSAQSTASKTSEHIGLGEFPPLRRTEALDINPLPRAEPEWSGDHKPDLIVDEDLPR